jgi:hypothetical protein
MSHWRLVVRELNERGPLHWAQIMSGPQHGLNAAAELGFVQRPGCATGVWSITELGRQWCEGRVQVVTTWPGRPGRKHMLAATWLHALPKPGQIQLGRQ